MGEHGQLVEDAPVLGDATVSGPEDGALLLQALAGRCDPPELFVVHELIGEQVVQPIEAPGIGRLLVVPS